MRTNEGQVLLPVCWLVLDKTRLYCHSTITWQNAVGGGGGRGWVLKPVMVQHPYRGSGCSTPTYSQQYFTSCWLQKPKLCCKNHLVRPAIMHCLSNYNNYLFPQGQWHRGRPGNPLVMGFQRGHEDNWVYLDAAERLARDRESWGDIIGGLYSKRNNGHLEKEDLFLLINQVL